MTKLFKVSGLLTCTVVSAAALLSGCGASMANIPDEAWPQVTAIANSVCGQGGAGEPVKTSKSESFGAPLDITVTYKCSALGAPSNKDAPHAVQAAGGGALEVQIDKDDFWEAISKDKKSHWAYLAFGEAIPESGGAEVRIVEVTVPTKCKVGDAIC